MARAFIVAARHYGELDYLCLRGSWPVQLRSMWVVAYALYASRRSLSVVDVARLSGLPANLEPAALHATSMRPGWDWDVAQAAFLEVAK